MELKVGEGFGRKRFDITAAEANWEKYSIEKQGLESALERTNYELGNAEKIVKLLERFSDCAYEPDASGKLFVFTKSGKPAVLEEFVGYYGLTIPGNYLIVPLADAQKVPCPGCPEKRVLIGCYVESRPQAPDLFVICGNSIHEIKRTQ